MKRLIVNADDLGLTGGVNRAIIDAHQRGVVTSTTLMANGPEFQQGAQMACFTPSLAVGCHVDLMQLAPVLPAEAIPSLVSDGRFRPRVPQLAMAALRGNLSADEIAAEATAQMRKLRAAGIVLSHFDTHKHTHVFPPLLRPLLRAARACGVPAVRNPFEPEAVIGLAGIARSPNLMLRYCAVRVLGAMAREFRRQVEAAGLTTTDGTVGIVLTGSLDQHRLCALLRKVPDGTWELVTHPGYDDAALRSLSSLSQARETELQALTSDETRRCITECGIELISFRELAVGRQPSTVSR